MKIEHEVRLTPEKVAEAFCELNDDQMAVFFEEVGRRAQLWPGAGAAMQWFAVGQHMKTCDCVTFEGRNVIETIYEAMK